MEFFSCERELSAAIEKFSTLWCNENKVVRKVKRAETTRQRNESFCSGSMLCRGGVCDKIPNCAPGTNI